MVSSVDAWVYAVSRINNMNNFKGPAMRKTEPIKDPDTPGCPMDCTGPSPCAVKPVVFTPPPASETTTPSPVQCPAKEEWSASKRKFWLSIIVTAFLMFNISAVVTAIAVVGIRTGKLPESTVVNSLIQLAMDVLKTVFAA